MAEVDPLLGLESEEFMQEEFEENSFMDNEELARHLQQEAETSIGVDNSEIASQRGENMERYLGEQYDDELAPVEGRSQIISRDVTDAVEWAMPQLMDVFFGSDTVVEAEAEAGETVQDVKRLSAWMNYVFLRQNNGFIEGYQFIKDALIQKDGIMKGWVEEITHERFEIVEGLTPNELMFIATQPYTDIVERDDYAMMELDPQTGEQFQVPMSDVKVRYWKPERKIKIKTIPPEEIKVSKRTRRNLQEAPYFAHVEEYTKGELAALLVQLGSEYDLDEVFKSTSTDPGLNHDPELIARHDFDGTMPDNVLGMEDREVCHVWEEYCLVDANGDGFEERLKVIRVGDYILYREETELIPFAHSSAVLISHKFNGLALADLVKDLAKIKTSLQRNILDNVYQQNNVRMAVIEDQVNMDDLLISRAGGIVRENISGAVRPLPAPQLPQSAFDMLGYLDQVRDERTGVSKLTQGLDPNALSSNVASGAVNQVMTAAQQRLKLMAMVLAEGFKEIFWIIHELGRLYMSGEEKFALVGEQMSIDFSRFMERRDFSVRVGLGTQEKQEKFMKTQMLAQDMQMITAQGGAGRIVNEQNVYNLAVERARLLGYKESDEFYTDPSQLPAPEQGPSEFEMEMMKMEAEAAKELEIHRMNIESRERIELAKLQREDRKLDLEEEEMLIEAEIEREQNRGVDVG